MTDRLARRGPSAGMGSAWPADAGDPSGHVGAPARRRDAPLAARGLDDGRCHGCSWRSARGASRRLVAWRRRRLARLVEAALLIEAAGLPPPRTAAERHARAEVLAATRAVVLATLTRLDPAAARAAGREEGR